MNGKRHYSRRLIRPSDLFLPAAFLIAALLGQGSFALQVFIAFYAVKLCALATSNGLRSAFARQPSMRYVQGSAALALLLQLPGAALAAALLRLSPLAGGGSLLSLVGAGALLNIEHVFYEYLFATGDGPSATLERGIASLLTSAGLLLGAPPSAQVARLAEGEAPWLLITAGLSALVGLAISLALGGRLRPRMNVDLLRRAPLSMLQTALYPALALAGLKLAFPGLPPAIPLFAGLLALEPWRTPFRRGPLEAPPMNRALLILCAVAAFVGMLGGFLLSGYAAALVAATCGAALLGALCAFALYGRIVRREE